MNLNNNRGLFIVLEGGEGCGKGTQAKRLMEYLKGQGVDAIHTREPGGTPLAEELRSAILDSGLTEHISSTTELLIMFAARNQNLINRILPALNNGTWVVCERFIDTTYAYQVRAGDASPSLYHALVKEIVGDNQADITLLLDLPEHVYRERLAKRERDPDRLDNQLSEFHNTVRLTLKERACLPNHYVINADQPRDEVSFDIQLRLTQFLQRSPETPMV